MILAGVCPITTYPQKSKEWLDNFIIGETSKDIQEEIKS
jgi:hypothetical protein